MVIVDAENGAYEIHRRVHTLELPAEGVHVYEAEGFDLRTHLSELEAILERHHPALLVLDSFRTLWGGKENDSDAVSGVLDPLRNLVRRYEAGTLLLHHVGRAHGSPYRGSSAFGASCELGFTLARKEDDEDPTRRYVQCWKCRPAPEPMRRWLTLSAEGSRVFVDRADPPEAGEEEDRPAAGRVRAKLLPRVLDALDGGPLSRADVARSVGRDPKDRSVGRALDALLVGGQVAKEEGDPGGPDRWARKGVATPPEPLGSRHPATPSGIPLSKAEKGGGGGGWQPLSEMQPFATPRRSECDCRTPARSPRANGPDFCQTCKRPIA